MPEAIASGRGHRKAPPLAAPDAHPEQPVGHHGDQRDAAGQHGLDHRHRCKRQSGHVQHPREAADAHPDREPLRSPERDGGAQRVPDVDRGAGTCAAVLEEEREVAAEGAEQREQDSEVERHALEGRWAGAEVRAADSPCHRRPPGRG
jgi:hypothetical protein